MHVPTNSIDRSACAPHVAPLQHLLERQLGGRPGGIQAMKAVGFVERSEAAEQVLVMDTVPASLGAVRALLVAAMPPAPGSGASTAPAAPSPSPSNAAAARPAASPAQPNTSAAAPQAPAAQPATTTPATASASRGLASQEEEAAARLMAKALAAMLSGQGPQPGDSSDNPPSNA